jgi:hypothetical protein
MRATGAALALTQRRATPILRRPECRRGLRGCSPGSHSTTMRKTMITLALPVTLAALAALWVAVPVADLPEAEPLQAAPTPTAKQYALKTGAAGTAKLTIKPAKGFKFNKEYPSKFTVAAAAFAKPAKEKLTAKEGDVKVAGTDGVVTIPLQGVAAGAGALSVTGNFSICNAEQCFMLRNEALQLQVSVK